MRLRMLTIVVILGFATAGCSLFGVEPARWSLEVTGYDIVRRIDFGDEVTGLLEAEDGAEWLRLFVALTNHADEPYEIDWQVDTFIFADEEGVTRPEELEWVNLPGYLDMEFGPGATNAGFIVFPVDPEHRVTAGTLTWKPAEGNLITVELDGVPEK